MSNINGAFLLLQCFLNVSIIFLLKIVIFTYAVTSSGIYVSVMG